MNQEGGGGATAEAREITFGLRVDGYGPLFTSVDVSVVHGDRRDVHDIGRLTFHHEEWEAFRRHFFGAQPELLEAADMLCQIHGTEAGAVSTATVHEAVERLAAAVAAARGEGAS